MMVHTCTIRRNTPATSASRQVSAVYANLATGVACFEQQQIGRSRLGGAGVFLEFDAIVFLPSGTDVRPKNACDIPDQLVVNGTTYLVQWAGDENGMEDHLTAYCKRFQSGT